MPDPQEILNYNARLLAELLDSTISIPMYKLDDSQRATIGGYVKKILEITHPPREGIVEVYRAAMDEEQSSFTFQEWMQDRLSLVDPGITVEKDAWSRLRIMLNGDWPIATIYGPPEGLLDWHVDTYPRQMQTEMFRQIIFAMNSFFKLATDMHTGVPV